MDKQRKKELLEQAKQEKKFMGIVQFENLINGKIFLDASPNLRNQGFSMKAQLNMGMHPNKELQKDWTELGEAAFSYQVLEKKDHEKVEDLKWEMKQMLKIWLEKLQPYGEKGYNKPPRD